MKKIVVSIIGGVLFGITVTFLFLDYEAFWTTYIMSDTGEIVGIRKEMDFDFVFSLLLFSAIGIAALYLIGTFIEKKQSDKSLEEYNRSKEADNK